MEPVRSGCFCAFILFLAVRLHVTDCVKVIVGDPFKIPVSCEPGESVTLQRVRLDGPRDVGTDESGQWTVSREEDRERIKLDSSHIVFTRTFYTDGGIYELTCSKETIQLEVVYASEKSVTVGDNVTLPCYYKPIGGTDLVRWERNGKPLCVKNSNYEGCSWTPADRLTVSTDWITSGDLSLTIEGVQPEDGGDYFCYIHDQHGKQSGTPAAVRVTVIEKTTHQMINITAAPRNQTQSHAEHTQLWQISTWVLLSVVLLLVVLLWFLCCGKINCDSGKLYKLVERRCHPSNSSEAANV